MVIFTLTACLGGPAVAQHPRLERDACESRMGSTLVAVEELPGWTDPDYLILDADKRYERRDADQSVSQTRFHVAGR
jgi:hypothetical protein